MSDITNIDIGKLGKNVMDTILTSNNPVSLYFFGNNPKPFQSSQYLKAIKYTTTGQGSSFTGGDQLGTQNVSTTAQLAFTPKYFQQGIVLFDTDLAQNASDPNKAVDYMTYKIEEAKSELMDSVETQFFGDGTGNNGKNFTGIKAIVDDGTVSATYGGLSRTTYSSLDSYYNGSGGTLDAVSDLGTPYNACSVHGESPDLIITTPTLWATLEGIISLTQYTNVDRATIAGYRGEFNVGGSANSVNIGIARIKFRNADVVASTKCTAGHMYFLNTGKLGWYGQAMEAPGYKTVTVGGNKALEGLYSRIDGKNIGLSMTEFVRNTDQLGSVARIVLGGNFISEAPNRHGKVIFS